MRRLAREQPAWRASEHPWALDAALAVLTHELGREEAELCQRGGRLEQALVMECLYRSSRASQREIGQRLGEVDYSWVSRHRKTLRRTLPQASSLQSPFLRLQIALTHEERSAPLLPVPD